MEVSTVEQCSAQPNQQKKHNTVRAITYPMPLTLNEAAANSFLEQVASKQIDRAKELFHKAFIKEDGQTKYCLQNNRPIILRKTRRLIFRKTNMLYLFNNSKNQIPQLVFFVRMLNDPDIELEMLQNYFFYITLYRCCGGEQDDHCILQHHSVYKQLEILSELTTFTKKEKHKNPLIIWRYTILFSATIEDSIQLMQQLGEIFKSEYFLSLSSDKKLNITTEYLMKEYNRWITYHQNNFTTRLNPLYRMWVHKAKVNGMLLTCMTLSNTLNRCDQIFLESVDKLFTIFEDEYNYCIQNMEKNISNGVDHVPSSDHVQNIEKTTKTVQKREVPNVVTPKRKIKYPNPFQEIDPIDNQSIYELQKDLKKAGLTNHRLDEIKDLFLNDRLKKPIIWIGTYQELYSLIMILQDLKIIKPKKRSYWEQLSKLFLKPSKLSIKNPKKIGYQKIKAKQLRKCTLVDQDHIIHKICHKMNTAKETII
ncbi:hypothetical protein K5X82_04975 [Halosquirtibacter xylanolyticus]|uniref:hypothetical protein n=1 Tax=Halosquirtibacter xylanolyticus TaxID=3374599 RepID=UPI003748004B|nr:hypothetical protein K5X82_04975 [Prolixibacteraceae bacterium]